MPTVSIVSENGWKNAPLTDPPILGSIAPDDRGRGLTETSIKSTGSVCRKGSRLIAGPWMAYGVLPWKLSSSGGSHPSFAAWAKSSARYRVRASNALARGLPGASVRLLVSRAWAWASRLDSSAMDPRWVRAWTLCGSCARIRA
jgi:hypothetical protein